MTIDKPPIEQNVAVRVQMNGNVTCQNEQRSRRAKGAEMVTKRKGNYDKQVSLHAQGNLVSKFWGRTTKKW